MARVSSSSVALRLLEDYGFKEPPNAVIISNIYGCSYNTALNAVNFLKDRRYLINGTLEAGIQKNNV